MVERLGGTSTIETAYRHEVQPWSNLEVLTFTGLDFETNAGAILEIGRRYPRVEFGVLAGSHAGEDSHRRYPSIGEIKWWRGACRKDLCQVAIHLCGRYARGALGQQRQGDPETEEVLRLCKGFTRVQINAQEYDSKKVTAFAEAVECQKVILQRRGAIDPKDVLPDLKVEYLFDVSGGRGIQSLTEWPAPAPQEVRSGYAGGLGLDNIEAALNFVARHRQSGRRLWLDMESKVRTSNDYLNIGHVQAICEIAFPNN